MSLHKLADMYCILRLKSCHHCPAENCGRQQTVSTEQDYERCGCCTGPTIHSTVTARDKGKRDLESLKERVRRSERKKRHK